MPWRKHNGALQFLLITTRTTQRWIVPKGWPLRNLSPSECAAREALEEAGVVGEIGPKSLGAFQYTKRRKDGVTLPVRIEVFAMEVMRQRRTWEEKSFRQTCWCSLDEALERVAEPGLRRLIVKFAKDMH